MRRCGLAVLAIFLACPVEAQITANAIRPGDSVSLVVADQPTLTNTYIVRADGIITVPLIGQVTAAGLTPDQLSASLGRQLAEFLTVPDVRVALDRTRRIFVFGGVPRPGRLDLTGDMTLLEALSRSGYSGTSEVVVVRPADARGPAAIDDPRGETIRVNLAELEKELETGQLSRNLLLTDGDTIYVPDTNPNEIRVSGQVVKPGAYSIAGATTVLQALALAGGVTETAAVGRVRVARVIDGDLRSLNADDVQLLQPGDTIVVPEKIPFPAIDIGPALAGGAERGRIRFGRALSIRPAFALKQVGTDSNVFNETNDTVHDFTVVAGPQLEATLDLRRVVVKAVGDVDFVYFRRVASERSVNRYVKGSADLMLSRRLTVRAAGSLAHTRDRLNAELDGRVRRFDRSVEAALHFQPWSRLELEIGGRDWDRRIDAGATFLGVDLEQTLTERIRSLSATARLRMTSITWLVASETTGTHRFALFRQKNADATEVSAGVLMKSGGPVTGEARVGHLRYTGLDAAAPDISRPVGGAELFFEPRDRTRFGLTLERTVGNSFQPEFPYAMIDRAGGSLQQGFSRRFDVLLQAYRENYTYSRFVNPVTFIRPSEDPERTNRYAAEVGIRIGPIRVGVNTTYLERISAVRSVRNYHALWTMANVSYGVFEARGR